MTGYHIKLNLLTAAMVLSCTETTIMYSIFLTIKDGKQDLPSPVGVMSYVIVPALPKGALVEWHIVAQENQIQCNGMFEESSIEFGNCNYQYHFIGTPQSRSNQNSVLSSECRSDRNNVPTSSSHESPKALALS